MVSRKDLFLLSILTLITAIGWIVFDIYHASVDTTIPPEIEEQLTPITPTFERKVVESLKNRQFVEPQRTQGFPETIPTGAASPEGKENIATQSGGR